jgi:hypothetical protein
MIYFQIGINKIYLIICYFFKKKKKRRYINILVELCNRLLPVTCCEAAASHGKSFDIAAPVESERVHKIHVKCDMMRATKLVMHDFTKEPALIRNSSALTG